MYYLIYKVYNLINGKYYIGLHRTENPGDNYMGSGTYINTSINKYGVDNFKKEIIFCAFDKKSMEWAESIFVTQKEVDDPMCYNLVPGGGNPPDLSGTIIITNGTIEARILVDQRVPEGWWKGRAVDGVKKAAESRKIFYKSLTTDERKLLMGQNKGKIRAYDPILGEQILTQEENIPDGFVRGLLKDAPTIAAFDPITGVRRKFWNVVDIPKGWIVGINWNSKRNKGLRHYYNSDGVMKDFETDEDAFAKGFIFKGNIAASKALKGTNVVFDPISGNTNYVHSIDDVDITWMPGRPHKKYKSFICHKRTQTDRFFVITLGSEMSYEVNRVDWELGVPKSIIDTFGKYQYNTKGKFFCKKKTYTTDHIPDPDCVFVNNNFNKAFYELQ